MRHCGVSVPANDGGPRQPGDDLRSPGRIGSDPSDHWRSARSSRQLAKQRVVHVEVGADHLDVGHRLRRHVGASRGRRVLHRPRRRRDRLPRAVSANASAMAAASYWSRTSSGSTTSGLESMSSDAPIRATRSGADGRELPGRRRALSLAVGRPRGHSPRRAAAPPSTRPGPGRRHEYQLVSGL